ncbi:ABC transporter ATP-binding protein [Salipaludibacillus agaradhaerens]|uniref:ABC transporter ATP-binding protein n=1 Tax=Salipaludibacillus agaradhaerens TaxID=76935 RepID=UPI002151655D
MNELSKQFKLKQKEQGLKGSLRSILKPNFKAVHAINNVSFSVNHGEMVALIGPNGAGKSTLIKMLTGILNPSSGESRILGLNPIKERKKLAYQIGTVYGQKSQLWFHLPPIDTFHLFAKIYEIDNNIFNEQLDFYVELLQIEKYLNTPTRRLSLGQRMKCEIVASLLHKPKVLFLDEPTIGLDVVAKQQIRQGLIEMNRNEGTSIVLTSHDAGDIEAICNRSIIVNHGNIIYDDKIDLLKKNYLTHKILSIQFSDSIKNYRNPIDEAKLIFQNNISAKYKVDTRKTKLQTLIKQVADRYPIADISITEPTMEEIITKIYTNHEDNSIVNK